MNLNKDDYIWIEYIFDFSKPKSTKKFLVLLDKDTLIATPPENSQDTRWTDLDFYQCEICPLKKESVKKCPIAYIIYRDWLKSFQICTL